MGLECAREGEWVKEGIILFFLTRLARDWCIYASNRNLNTTLAKKKIVTVEEFMRCRYTVWSSDIVRKLRCWLRLDIDATRCMSVSACRELASHRSRYPMIKRCPWTSWISLLWQFFFFFFGQAGTCLWRATDLIIICRPVYSLIRQKKMRSPLFLS